MDDPKNQNNPIKTIYADVLTDILSENINIKTFSRRLRPEVEGLFAPPFYNDAPLIKVQRQRGGKSLTTKGAVASYFSGIEEFLNDENIINLERELLVLAHEFGHYKSYRAGRPPGLDDAARLLGANEIDEMMPYQKKIIVDEEVCAWAYAQKILEQKGYGRWRVFENMKEGGLEAYRALLKTPILENKNWFFTGQQGRILPPDKNKQEAIKQINKIYLENKKVLVI